uniref:CD226 antigen-like n=1 Tax=Epinephelus lanceolatus TaxID=310571 RepID=UPI0014474DFC|nr:CD226 antigen-like [Epinephelus lanceolatus]
MAPFLLLLFPLCAAASDQHVTVHPGDDVTLRCEAADVSIRAVEWTRPDLEPQYVLFYRDGHLEIKQQHPSFTGRVELEDRELKDGDVSLTLKNVTSSDSGTYECRVKSDGFTRTKRANIDDDPIRVIYLEVTDSEDGNSTPILVAVGVVAVLLVAAAVFVAVWRYKRRSDQRSERPAADEAGTDQLMCTSAV